MDEPKKVERNWQPKLILFFGLLTLVLLGLILKISHHQAIRLSSSVSQIKNSESNVTKSFLGSNWLKPVNDSIDLDFVEIDTISDIVNLEIWKFDMQPSLGVVALFHDYKKTKSSLWNEALSFYRMGYTVVLADLRNSGNSDGTNSTFGYLEAIDVQNVYKWCLNEYPEDQIFLYGMSTGATAVLRAVSELNISPDGIIIQACFPNLKSFLVSQIKYKTTRVLFNPHLIVYWLTNHYDFDENQIDALYLANKINTPTLLIHGLLDENIQFDETNQIFKALQGPKEIATFSKSGHESILINEEANWVYLVTNFMQSHNH